MEIFKEFKFEAAHRLPNLPEGHKCRNLHGHSYRVRVFVRGRVDPSLGWVVPFEDIGAACKPLIEQLDHSFLNEVEGLSQSTSEHLAYWFWKRVKPALPGLARIEIWETATSGAIYSGEDDR
jgi:6-pyruvoyltetrahydropterin/6-carboxytetrahydropterin synthase